ncbi:MAG: hypothetical protein ACREX9_06635 [Gammaproteobacteria bacterium]
MQEVSTWEAVLLGVLALLLVFWFRPGIKEALRQSQETEHKDWAGALIPITLVVLFVILLIVLAKS